MTSNIIYHLTASIVLSNMILQHIRSSFPAGSTRIHSWNAAGAGGWGLEEIQDTPEELPRLVGIVQYCTRILCITIIDHRQQYGMVPYQSSLSSTALYCTAL